MYLVIPIVGADERLYVKVNPGDTFLRLKEVIQGKKSCAPEYQRLHFRGMLMPDDITLETYGITAGEDDCAPQQIELTMLEEGPIPIEEIVFLNDVWTKLGGIKWKRTVGWENVADDPCNALGVRVEDQHIVGFVMPDNNLRGRIPESIANCTRLQEFMVPYNLLEGDIPPSLYRCRDLRRLSLQWNRLSGPISDGIGYLTRLEQFFADHNMLSGMIPEAIGGCRQLLRLNLANNRLHGGLPADLCHLHKLGVLQLQGNQIVLSKEINLNMPAQDLVTWARWEKVKRAEFLDED